jgi:hypothetical protein
MTPQNDYKMMIITDIMFVETKNSEFRTTSKGVVFNDGKAFYVGGHVKFNGVSYEIKTVPEVETVGSKNWVKVTFHI